MAIQPPPQATAPEFFPIAPARTEDSGLPVARLADLLLKHIYFKSPMSAKDWAAALCLPYQTVTPAIQSLVEQGWVQTIGRMAGPSQSHDLAKPSATWSPTRGAFAPATCWPVTTMSGRRLSPLPSTTSRSAPRSARRTSPPPG